MSSIISSGSGSAQSYYESKAMASAQEQNAQLALMESREVAKGVREQTTTLTGEQKLLYAKAGVDISSGSPLLMIKHTREEGEKKAREIERKGRAGYNLAHWGARLTEKAGRMSSASQGISSLISAATMGIGGIAGGVGGGAMGAVQGAIKWDPSAGFGSYLKRIGKQIE